MPPGLPKILGKTLDLDFFKIVFKTADEVMPTFKPFGVKYIILLGPFHTNLSNESAMVFRLIFRERRVGILCLQLLLYYQNF